jgi:hypothetical protein
MRRGILDELKVAQIVSKFPCSQDLNMIPTLSQIIR